LSRSSLHAWGGLLGGTAAAAVCLAAAWVGRGASGIGVWAAGLWFLLAGFAMLGCLGRRLPLQNIGAVLLASLASAFLGLTFILKSGFFADPLLYADGFGPKVLGLVPWPLPFLWVALALSSRESARLILRPWRRARYYGLWLIGVAATLVLWTELGFQPFALHVVGWWSYAGAMPEWTWQGVPWAIFPASFALAVFVLGFASPWLVAKRPVPTAPEGHPVAVWVSLNLCFLIGNVWRGLWLPAAAALVGGTVVVLMAYRVLRAAPANREEPPMPAKEHSRDNQASLV